MRKLRHRDVKYLSQGHIPSKWQSSDLNPGNQRLEASLVAQMVKNLPAMQETWFWSLGWEDSLEKGMSTHSSILVWRIPWTEEPGRLQSMGLQRVVHDWTINTLTHRHTDTHTHRVSLWGLCFIRKSAGNPFPTANEIQTVIPIFKSSVILWSGPAFLPSITSPQLACGPATPARPIHLGAPLRGLLP